MHFTQVFGSGGAGYLADVLPRMWLCGTGPTATACWASR